ncbi:TadE/TadG family type IV pilus assembly protein [Sneathiella glossodoripedis]|uniref:TadE/TadG family type IV pilus assembly protein n=1 Tax=Sneathiella glossodoripedis TaxID=418853 RepID=UPI000470C850|nr:TadE/TadG family type IV pilus assembly protein [Sneathiella glossodoripedis]
MKRMILFDQLRRSRLFTRFLKDKSAVAMTEFAMLLPLLLLLTVGSFEVGRYALLTQKLDRISATMADLVARAEA